MKIIFVAFVVFVLACSNNQKVQESTGPAELASIDETPTHLPKKNACDYIAIETIAEIMDWNPSLVVESLAQNIEGSSQTICSYVQQADKLIIRLAWQNTAQSEAEKLENQYARLLQASESGFTFREIKGGKDQIIYGYGSDPFGQSLYIFRRRFGNDLEIQIDAVNSSLLPDLFETRFNQMIELIEQSK